MLTRLAALALIVTCASSGAVVANADGSTPTRATTYADLPVGAPTTLPWWQHRRLHVGSTVIRTGRGDIASRSGTTVVAVSADRRMGRPGRWFLVTGKRLMRLPMRTRTQKPLVSANGHWIAWLEVHAHRTQAYRRIERYRVVLYDAVSHHVVNSFHDRRRVAWEDGINAIWLRTLSNQGRLVLSQGSDGVKVLSANGRPVSFTGPQVGNGADVDGWPGGTTVYRWKSETSLYGEVGRHGDFDRAGRFTVAFSGLWSPDGTHYAYDHEGPDTTTYWVRPLAGASVRLDVPQEPQEFDVVGWDSPDSVVLWFFDDYSPDRVSLLVRCSATTGACEQVPRGPKAGRTATMPSRY